MRTRDGTQRAADRPREARAPVIADDRWVGRRVLVTGGLGFIGSSVAVRLAQAGAQVTVLDALLPAYGGNLYNLASVTDRVRLVQADVRDLEAVRAQVAEHDMVFHFAAQVSYLDSMKDPLLDLDISLRGTLNVLEACRQGRDGVRFITVGSRMQFGEVRRLPVDETQPMRPGSFYALHKLVAEEYCRLYHEAFGLWTAFLRLSNPYGPRQQIKHGKYGIVNWFVRLALQGHPLTVFGDGAQVRDYFYIDDAVEAFLAAAAQDGPGGETFNIGGGKPISFKTMTETIAAATGARVEYVSWPAEWKQVETGDYITDIAKALRVLGWAPKVDFADGIRRTVAYYRAAFERYA